MKASWPRLSVRSRLTLWYVGAMVLVLAMYATAVFAFVSTNASNALNARLRDDFRWASEMVEQVPNGSLVMFEGDDGSAEPDRP